MDKSKATLNIHPERDIRLYWRSENWDEVDIHDTLGDGWYEDYSPREIFEAGANALFNALIFHCGKYVVDCEFPWVSKDGLTSGTEHKDGWQITIPADEVHKK